MSTSPYHHGNLRRVLIAAALDQLKNGGAASVGLREAARAAGVSPSAPYRHFSNRAALLAAVAAEGFRTFHADLRAAQPEGLAAMGLAYVRFALANPALFRLMFSPEAEEGRDPLLRAESQSALKLLAEETGAGAGPIGPATIGAWALVHGLALLLLDDQIPGVGLQGVEALVGAVTARWNPGDTPA